MGAGVGRTERDEQGRDVAEPTLEEDGDGIQARAQRQGRIDRPDSGDKGRGIDRCADRGRNEVVLGGEDPEDRSLRNPGGLGDLARRHGAAVLAEQRQGDLDEGCAALFGAERGRPAGLHSHDRQPK